MASSRFEITTGKDKQFYFNLIAANNEPILRSEGYTTKAACLNGVASVQSNAPKDDRYDRKKSKNDQFYFNLTAANHEVIGVSEMYTTEQARDNGIGAVKRGAAGASVEDKT